MPRSVLAAIGVNIDRTLSSQLVTVLCKLATKAQGTKREISEQHGDIPMSLCSAQTSERAASAYIESLQRNADDVFLRKWR